MLQVRRDQEIHREDGGWFQARWHFSFDRYRDPEQMGVGPLRVFNHDRLSPGAVWPMHPHADIEGITYVWNGAFKHRSEEHTSELQSPIDISYAVFCLKKKKKPLLGLSMMKPCLADRLAPK